MNHPLQTILDEIDARHRAGERPVVIFDLDGTLYDNRPRTIRIVHALAASLPPECDRDAAIIRALGPGDLRYRLDDPLRPLGVSEDVITLAKERWFRRFFTDTACADDVPMRGAAPFVQRCSLLSSIECAGGSVATLRTDSGKGELLIGSQGSIP